MQDSPNAAPRAITPTTEEIPPPGRRPNAGAAPTTASKHRLPDRSWGLQPRWAIRGFERARPSPGTKSPHVLVGLLTPELKPTRPSHRARPLKQRCHPDTAMAIERRGRFLLALGYSGGAVPDLHRVPCSSALGAQAADHQHTVKRPGAYQIARSLSSARRADLSPFLVPGPEKLVALASRFLGKC